MILPLVCEQEAVLPIAGIEEQIVVEENGEVSKNVEQIELAKYVAPALVKENIASFTATSCVPSPQAIKKNAEVRKLMCVDEPAPKRRRGPLNLSSLSRMRAKSMCPLLMTQRIFLEEMLSFQERLQSKPVEQNVNNSVVTIACDVMKKTGVVSYDDT